MYRKPVPKKSRLLAISIILGVGILFILLVAIVLVIRYSEEYNRNASRNIALNFMKDILEEADRDDMFTLTDAGQFYFIRLFYDISYNGEYDDFVNSSIEFSKRVNGCIYAKYPELNEQPRLVSWQDEYRLYINTEDGMLFLNFDILDNRVGTNVFLEDYSVFENNIERIDQLRIYTSDFTDGQKEHLYSVKNQYSFEVYIIDKPFIRETKGEFEFGF